MIKKLDKAITECLDVVNNINTTVTRKANHFPKLLEIKKAFDYCYDKTGCCLFETRYSVWEDYNRAFELNETKKKLDKLLKANKRYLLNELIAFRNDLKYNKGED